jgi:flagellar basal-body rod protein FlgB
MFIERLLDDGNAPLLEQMLRFTDARHKLLAENIVNVSTPGYRQKDLSVEKFQRLLADRVETRDRSPRGAVSFDDIGVDVEQPSRGILFHDGNNRTMDQLMSDEAKNAIMHNMIIELLRKQFSQLENALKERVT